MHFLRKALHTKQKEKGREFSEKWADSCPCSYVQYFDSGVVINLARLLHSTRYYCISAVTTVKCFSVKGKMNLSGKITGMREEL